MTENLYNVDGRFNENTWISTRAGDRLVYTYDRNTKKLAYFPSTEDGAYVRSADISVRQTAKDTHVVGSDFSISRPVDAPGGATFDGSRWQAV